LNIFGDLSAAQVAQHFQPGQARQAQIQHHCSIRLGGKRLFCRNAVLDPVDSVAGLFQAGLDRIAQQASSSTTNMRIIHPR